MSLLHMESGGTEMESQSGPHSDILTGQCQGRKKLKAKKLPIEYPEKGHKTEPMLSEALQIQGRSSGVLCQSGPVTQTQRS